MNIHVYGNFVVKKLPTNVTVGVSSGQFKVWKIKPWNTAYALEMADHHITSHHITNTSKQYQFANNIHRTS